MAGRGPRRGRRRSAFVFADRWSRLLGATGEVADQAVVYLRISLLGVRRCSLVLAGTGYLRGLQDTRTPLVVAIVSALLNLVLEVVLIYGFGFGIGASALSTVVAQWGAAAVYLLWVARAVRHHDVPLGARTARTLRAPRPASVATCSSAPLALRGSFLVATAVAARIGTGTSPPTRSPSRSGPSWPSPSTPSPSPARP